jgi:hypothetical protein
MGSAAETGKGATIELIQKESVVNASKDFFILMTPMKTVPD